MNIIPSLRKPTSEDGLRLNQLVAACPPLDANSIYCNLLQCTHFRDTAIAAELDGELVGFVSGYIPPDKPDTLFVWQVAIAAQQRGKGLAKAMLQQLLNNQDAEAIHFLETTITPGNSASWSLFRSLARELNTEVQSDLFFFSDRHFGNQHDEEHLLRIGPFTCVSNIYVRDINRAQI